MALNPRPKDFSGNSLDVYTWRKQALQHQDVKYPILRHYRIFYMITDFLKF